jgi:hypothetical protein
VKAGLPPFLLLYGEYELPYCDGSWAKEFFERLVDANNPSSLVPISHCDHVSIVSKLAESGDQGKEAILKFIRSNSP